jgi:GTP-binding protein YchF
MLNLGIIGLPQSGKTTVFNAISGSHASTGDYSTSKGANVSVVKLPDERLARTAEIFDPKRIVNAEIEYIDIAGLTKGASSDRKKEAAYIHAIRQTDALLHVVRCFENPNVPHPEGSVDSIRDIGEVDTELILADLVTIENRMGKIEKNLKVVKNEQEKAEFKVLEKLKSYLESEKPLRSAELSGDDLRAISHYGLLTLKPMLYILNLGEDQIPSRKEVEGKFAYLAEMSQSGVASICASLQMDIADFDESERREFMRELGLESEASEIIIKKSFELLGMISFLTGNKNEVHSWQIRKGSTAHEAAGAVHSDIQRGFIKAEVVKFENLDSLGSWAKAREAGKLALHGKDYVVEDGDVILFMFNV